MDNLFASKCELLELGVFVPEKEDLDFRMFIAEPQVPFDIVVSNKNVGFRCHKNILRKISSVFDDIISGDAEMKELPLNDISNQNMKVLQKLIYEKPKDRNETFGENMNSKNVIINSVLFASKYHVVFIRDALVNNTYTIVFAGQLWEELKSQNLTTEADIVFKSHAQSTRYIQKTLPQSLKGVPMKMVKEMTRHCTSSSSRRSRSSALEIDNAKNWMQKFIEYAICSKEDEGEIAMLKTLIRERLSDKHFFDQDAVVQVLHELLENKPWCNII